MGRVMVDDLVGVAVNVVEWDAVSIVGVALDEGIVGERVLADCECDSVLSDGVVDDEMDADADAVRERESDSVAVPVPLADDDCDGVSGLLRLTDVVPL